MLPFLKLSERLVCSASRMKSMFARTLQQNNLTSTGIKSWTLTSPGVKSSTLTERNYTQRTKFLSEYSLHKDNLGQKRHFSAEKKVTALAIIKDLTHLKSSPKPALILGVSGLIPFVAPPLYMMLSGTYLAGLAYSQVAYGACILSFVGAVRWGMALSEDGIVQPNWVNLGYSVTPSLVAWLGLMMPTPFALSTLMLGLGGAAYMDLTMYGYPSWFKAMRFLLSLTAILSLWTTLMCMFLYSAKRKQKRALAVQKTKESSTPNNKNNLTTIATPAVPQEVSPVENEIQKIIKATKETNKTNNTVGESEKEVSDHGSDSKKEE